MKSDYDDEVPSGGFKGERSNSMRSQQPRDLGDIDPDSEKLMAAAKPSRRSRNEDTESSNAKHNEEVEGKNTASDAGAGRRRRRTENTNEASDGGWMSLGGNNDIGATRGSRAQAAAAAAKDIEQFEDDDNDNPSTFAADNKEKHFQGDDDDDIVIIPDLDDEGGVDTDQRIAHAPKNITRKLPTLSDLDSALSSQGTSVLSDNGGYNFSILLNTLIPADKIVENDTEWTFESLLRELTDELSPAPQTIRTPSKTNDREHELYAKYKTIGNRHIY